MEVISEVLKRIVTISIILALVLVQAAVLADTQFAPYNSYVYNNKYEPVSVPNAFLPEEMILASADGGRDLAQPEDLFVWHDELVYVSDTGNDRIVVFDSSFNIIKIIDVVTVDGLPTEMNGPNGLYVNDDGHIYVCDTGNSRILVLDDTNTAIQVLTQPSSKDYPSDAGFEPTKLVVDGSGNVYAVVKNIYQGAVVFDIEGNFDGFFGAANVESTLQIITQVFFKQFMTKEQRSKIPKYVPTEFLNIEINDDFIYTCTNDTDLYRLIRKFNPAGVNIANNRRIFGDLNVIWNSTSNTSMSSQFVDICIDENSYSYVLDNTYGKIFIYDENFNLLFIFGIKATAIGTVQFPSAIDKLGEQLLVLDKGRNCIFTYSPTDFFGYVETANILYNNGLYNEAVEPWSEVLAHCSNYEPAYAGLGQAMYSQNRYYEAMTYFKKANDPQSYSDAYKFYRAIIIRENFTFFMLGLIALSILVIIAFKKSKRISAAIIGLLKRLIPDKYAMYLKYPVYVLRHPIEGFEEMRNHERSSYLVSALVLFLWVLSQLMKEKGSGFIFSSSVDSSVDMVFLKTIVVFILWVISNWGLRTFLSGRGSLRDIVSASAYALVPYTIFSFLYVIGSNFLIMEEGMFLNMLMNIGLMWSLFLMISAMKAIHEYEVGRTVVSLLLTALGVVLIVFLFILFFSSLQQVFDLLVTIFSELKYRA